MPYIPPPRPPSIPKPPSIPAFRPPQHNFHQQQQRMFHQQQQQRVFQQNQQQRVFHQQQQQRVFQQNLRQQDMHRQQQDRLRRDDQFRRQQQLQQDNLRRQQQLQQDQFRRQQQSHQQQQQQSLSRQTQQAQLLRNFQSSSELNGPTVVHISPGFSFEMSGMGTSGVQLTGNGFQFDSGGVQMNVSGMEGTGLQFNTQPPPPQATPTAPPPTGATSQPTGPPPPYPDFGPAPVHPKAQYTQSSPAGFIPTTPPPPLVGREDNRILLADGTQIVVEKEDEILFIGPTGLRMVVNCLPLYEPPPEGVVVKETARRAHTIHARHSPAPLKKTQSEDLLSAKSNTKKETVVKSSEAEDIERKKVQEAPAAIDSTHKAPVSSQGSSQGSPKGSHANTIEQTIPMPGVEEKSERVENGKAGKEGEGEVDREEVRGKAEEITEATDNVSDEGSDQEDGEAELSVKYEEELRPGLRRSSGSVSFISGVSVSPSQPPDESSVKEDIAGEAGKPEGCGVPEGTTQATSDSTEKTEDLQATPTSTGPTEEIKAAAAASEENEGGATPGSEEKEGGAIPGSEEKEGGAIPGSEEKEGDATPGSGFQKPPLLVEADKHLSQPYATPTAPPVVPLAAAAPPAPSPRTPTLLPSPPSTLQPAFMDRSGWLSKLSHRKGVFGDKWQKRYFVLHGSWIYYFKKYGDANPRGAIRLLPGGWSKPVPQGTPRMADAVANLTKGAGIISILRCLCVHRPSNHSASLSALLSNEGVAETFRSQTVSVSNPQFDSRTYYMVAASNEERDAWVEALQTNIKAHSYSSEALMTACKELRAMLRAVNSSVPPNVIPSILFLLHQKKKSLQA